MLHPGWVVLSAETSVLRWFSAPVPLARRRAPRAADRCAAGRPLSYRRRLDSLGDESLDGGLIDSIIA
ncbi:hypothetical protein BE11_05715 [Sorangium cellulosum]|nr:hypothetical protein BE11_05715 [Sorangium cellulosum]